MIKRILAIFVLVVALAVSAFFTSLNPGEIQLDLAFTSIASPLGLAFVVALAIGWLLGILSALTWVMRISAERRRLRAELKKSQASASSLAVRDERS